MFYVMETGLLSALDEYLEGIFPGKQGLLPCSVCLTSQVCSAHRLCYDLASLPCAGGVEE